MFAPQVRILVGGKGPNPEGEYTAQKTYLVLGFSDREVRIQGTQETKTETHVLIRVHFEEQGIPASVGVRALALRELRGR